MNIHEERKLNQIKMIEQEEKRLRDSKVKKFNDYIEPSLRYYLKEIKESYLKAENYYLLHIFKDMEGDFEFCYAKDDLSLIYLELINEYLKTHLDIEISNFRIIKNIEVKKFLFFKKEKLEARKIKLIFKEQR